ncbi:DUF2058 domain-containing protein [Tahibacter amnicola]|uniref:DUF2058 family protein n=1 Tax=Tahibacter amnicola TaxID=2976241 RepID=A0ABY6BK78_9GAMM|nr:DUF2058 family protein [Tahibacter amnicola]UXI70416.1 DUF2058 family protein [Tahibacter amnicola]
MADSLRDQLLKSGLVQKLKVEAKPAPKPASRPAGSGKPHHHKPGNPAQGNNKPAGPRSGEPDLAQAYALRAKTEREERDRAQREAEQRAREKRERKEKVAALLQGKTLNVADAEHPRHFPHGGKIRRIYCTSDQLAQVNKGELAVVQQAGRYLLVTADIARQIEALNPEALVLLVDPNAPADDDVPADLIW